jgi:hypothetical protein
VEFGVGMEIGEESVESCNHVRAFVDRLSDFIRARNYGSGIEHFTVGLIAIKSRPGYEGWYKQRRPRFHKVQKFRAPGQPTVKEFHNCYSYDVKLSDGEIDQFVVSGESAIKIFAQRFVSSLANLESSSMKKRHFDFKAFQEDLRCFVDSWV